MLCFYFGSFVCFSRLNQLRDKKPKAFVGTRADVVVHVRLGLIPGHMCAVVMGNQRAASSGQFVVFNLNSTSCCSSELHFLLLHV